MQPISNEIVDISSDDEDENEARMSCSLRWLISKAYLHHTIPDYLPKEHFFQNENQERFLSPDIALVLLSGDLYIRAFQNIINQQEEVLTYEDVIHHFTAQNVFFDMNLLKQDDPLNAHIHLELIDQLMRLYFRLNLDQSLLYQRFEKLQLKSLLALLNKSTQLNCESLLIVWLNGIGEYMSNVTSQRIPPVIDLRSAIIEGSCLSTLVSYYDQEYGQKKSRNELTSLRNYLNHYQNHSMTNIFPFTVKNLRENLIPDLNLQAMLVDLFVLFEKRDLHIHYDENEDEENICSNKSNQTYSINGDDPEDDINEFFILNNHSDPQPQSTATTGGILQASTNHERQMTAPMKSSLKTSVSSSSSATLPKKTSFMSTTTTWQRQALSNQATPSSTARAPDDLQLNNEYLGVKMQLEMKKRSIERDKQRLEQMRDNKRQTISEEAFKQLLQQKTKNTANLTNEFLSSPQIRKSQTTAEFRSDTPKTPPTPQQTLGETKKEESSIVDLSKPMTRDDFLSTLELLKQKYLETTVAAPTVVEESRHDEERRIEQLNSNIGELQQVINNLSEKQEEIHNQVVNANGGSVSRNATFSRKSLTFPRRPSTSTPREPTPQVDTEEEAATANGLVLDIVDDPSASTALEMERKRELVLQKQQQRQEAFEKRRQTRETENNKRDDERRKKDFEESTKKHEREQRRDEIYRQYMQKKEKKSANHNDHNSDEHPTIKMRPKTATSTQRRQTGPIVISTFGTHTDGASNTDLLNNTDLNETITSPSLSFVRLAEMRPSKTPTRTESRTLPRPSTRSTTEPVVPLIPVSEPRYPLAKPLSGKSNKQTIVNALSQVILAGKVNDRLREQVCEEVERNTEKIKHFIILFRDSRLQFRGVYAFLPATNAASDTPTRIERIFGQGPKEITESMIDTFYKYNNGSKQFSQVPIKSFSVQCDAVTISNQYWTQQSAASKRTTTTASALPLPPSD